MASSFNPYSAPNPDVVPAPAPAPGLPAGFRRFRLDPVAYRARVVPAMVRLGAIFIALPTLGIVIGLALGAAPTTLAVNGALVLFFVLSLAIQTRRFLEPNGMELSTFELLVGRRVLRRMAARTLPAEMLKPEVTRIVETKHGLWLLSEKPRRALHVPATLDGFAEVRALVTEWAPTERMSGWSAWRFAVRSNTEQGARDAMAGTALATDPTLAEELELARGASSIAYAHFPPPVAPRRTGWKMVALWVCLIVMFLAIWQLLSPEPQARSPRPAPRLESP